MKALLSLVLYGALTAPALSQSSGLLDRLRDLASPPPAAIDLYADEMAADIALIAAEADLLFDPARPGIGPASAPAAIALFVGPDCAACVTALRDLAALAERLGIRATVIDVSVPADAALLKRLSLDMLPSYVMPGGMIRGEMPSIVLERYLAP